jgi:hypothetical protein
MECRPPKRVALLQELTSPLDKVVDKLLVTAQEEGMGGAPPIHLHDRVLHIVPEQDSRLQKTIDEAGNLGLVEVVLQQPPDEAEGAKKGVFDKERTDNSITTEDWVGPCLNFSIIMCKADF